MGLNLDWNQFVEEHYEGIYRFCLSYFRSTDQAEDAVQNTFLKAWKNRRSLKSETSQKAWLYSIARNACRDKTRWWKRWHNTFSSNEAVEPEVFSQSILSITLEKLIAALPDRQREVFILRHWHGFDTIETARILGIHPGTVKSHLKRAIDSLKSSLELEEREMTTATDIETSYKTHNRELS